MPSNHLILCRPLLLPPSIFPSIRVFSNEWVLRIYYHYPKMVEAHRLLPTRSCLLVLPPGRWCGVSLSVRFSLSLRNMRPLHDSLMPCSLSLVEGGSLYFSLFGFLLYTLVWGVVVFGKAVITGFSYSMVSLSQISL